MDRAIHWEAVKKCGFEFRDKRYEHQPEIVLYSEDYKILWDFTVQTDQVNEAGTRVSYFK